MTAAHEAPPSTTLVAGKYQLLGLIGRGGMGSVWEGRHATLGTHVAIKFIEAEYANSADARSRFDNEARAAATIQSKHAIQIFDHGVTDDGKPYIVMEMLVGEPLDKRLDRMGRLPLQETARIIQQVSRALGRAHEKGIIHRDLKPENIFLVRSPDDDDEIAKVLDFGIAKIKGNPGEMGISSSTKTGAVLGTPFYMSPEQARGLRTIDHRTDIWSLGIITFKCATGKLPFDGESVGDLLVKICTSPVPVPSHVLPGLPPGFDAWFSRAMEREPDRRFGSVQEMSDALAYSAGITMRQPNSAGGPPQQMHQQMGMGPTVALGADTQRQTSNPAFHGSSPALALGGTQSPFTTSAETAIPKSNKGVVVASVLVALLVLGACAAAAVFIVKNKAPHEAGPVPTETTLATKPTPVESATAAKWADPQVVAPSDSSAGSSDPNAKPVAKAGGGTLPSTKPISNGGSTRPGTKPIPPAGQPVVLNSPPPPPPPTQAVTQAPPPPPVTRPPPAGKVKTDESGY